MSSFKCKDSNGKSNVKIRYFVHATVLCAMDKVQIGYRNKFHLYVVSGVKVWVFLYKDFDKYCILRRVLWERVQIVDTAEIIFKLTATV
jgi:hypothetical protein